MAELSNDEIIRLSKQYTLFEWSAQQAVAPIAMTKAQIIRRGLELGLDYALTTSCYDPASSGLPCGHCDSCLLRAKGFAEAGVPDPVRR